MLVSVGIENFKSYRQGDLLLSPLTALIGANASGKSNAIEALRLLSWIAQGNRLGAIRYAVQEADTTVRGKVSDLARRGELAFTLSCQTDDDDWHRFAIQLEERNDELHIVDERLTGPASRVPLYEVVAPATGAGSDARVAYNNFARGGHKPQVACNDQMAILVQLQSAVRFEAGHRRAQTVIPTVTKRFQKVLSDIRFLDPRPSAMRDYSYKTEHSLLESGGNLSGVLYNICHRRNESRDLLIDFIRSLPEQNINKIDFVETPRNEVMVELTETFGGENTKYDVTLLSDGTLRVLSIAAAVLSAPANSLVVIEEIDNGVHPSRAGHLLRGISNIAKDRHLRVLISSHNPALLDALPDDAVPNVVFCYRDPADGSSRLIRLRDVPDYPELIAQGSVGHLMTHGLLDRFVKQHPGHGERQERARAWLEELKAQAG